MDGPAHRLTPPDIGGAPNVHDIDGLLRIEWPSERGEHFLIRTSLFEGLIADLNAARQIAACLDQVREAIERLTGGR